MARYIALLRGINVSGQKIIKMEDLRKIFESFGLNNVKTYIQSGNVLFDSSAKNQETLTKKIEKGLAEALGYNVPVILRTQEEFVQIVELDPHTKYAGEKDSKFYVVFGAKELEKLPRLPFFSQKKDVEIKEIHKKEFFCLSHPLPNGTWGFPNAFVEKEFKIAATTRNWNTVNKLCGL